MSEQGKQTEVSIQQGTANVGSTIQSNTSGGVSVTGSTVNGNITSNDNRVTNNTYNNGPIQYRCPTPFAAPLKFGGRDRELAELKQRLKGENRVAIASLNGQGGIGKTTLARQLAYDLYHEPAATRSFRAVLWLELTPNPNELTLLREAANQATQPNSYDLPDGQPWEKLVGEVGRIIQNAIEQHCDECQPERVLVVLDDVWENGVELAQTLLDKLCPPNSTVLVTTRDFKVAARLGVQPGQRQDLAYLGKEAGAELLAQYLDNLPRYDLESLSDALGGYTLALTLAAKRLLAELNPARALPYHLDQYRQAIPLGSPFAKLELEQGQRKEDNLTRSLQYSYEALNEIEKSCFRALGALVANQPFDMELLAALWKLSADETTKIHKRLWQLALLEEDTATKAVYKGEWYRQQLILFNYARALLSEAGELEKHQRNYANYFAIKSAEYSPDFSWINPYWSALVVLLTRSANEPILMLILLSNMAQLLLNRGEITLLQTYLPSIIEEAQRSGSVVIEASILRNLGELKGQQGNIEEANYYLQKALFLYDKGQSLLDKANVVLRLGDLASRTDDIEKARFYYKDAIDIYNMEQSDQGIALALRSLGELEWRNDNIEKARAIFEHILPYYNTEQDRLGKANLLHSVGQLEDHLNNVDKARKYYRQAISLYKQEYSKLGQANVLRSLADLQRKLGNTKSARKAYTNALFMYETEQDKHGKANVLRGLGDLERQLGNQEAARELYKEALPLYEVVQDRLGRANVLVDLGPLRFEDGEQVEGLRDLEEAAQLYQGMQNFKWVEIAEKRLTALRQWQAELAEREKVQ